MSSERLLRIGLVIGGAILLASLILLLILPKSSAEFVITTMTVFIISLFIGLDIAAIIYLERKKRRDSACNLP